MHGVNMSKKDAVLLASRVIAVYLTVWLFTELAYLPERLFSFIHYVIHEPIAAGGSHYLRQYYLVGLATVVTRIIGLAVLARWLYKGGTGVEALLLPPRLEAESPSQT
jgi:hypothetical protein